LQEQDGKEFSKSARTQRSCTKNKEFSAVMFAAAASDSSWRPASLREEKIELLCLLAEKNAIILGIGFVIARRVAIYLVGPPGLEPGTNGL
jgi:hypothetical protein